MKNIPKISEAEWEIMKQIWDRHPVTSEEIISVLAPQMEWSMQTIKTFINRLLKKGVIGFEKEGRVYKYYPLISKDECIKLENKSFLKRVYDGALGMLFINFLEQEPLSKKDIERIEQILEKKKGQSANQGEGKKE